MTKKELKNWERRQAANRRAYQRERRAKISRRYFNAGMVCGTAWVIFLYIIIATFISGFTGSATVGWWIFGIVATVGVLNCAQNWDRA